VIAKPVTTSPVLIRQNQYGRCRNFPSSFSLTGYLPLYSSACLPSFSMWLRKVLGFLACIARATPI